jgi:hypothetical protein
VRNADNGEMNYELTEQVLNGETPSKPLPWAQERWCYFVDETQCTE